MKIKMDGIGRKVKNLGIGVAATLLTVGTAIGQSDNGPKKANFIPSGDKAKDLVTQGLEEAKRKTAPVREFMTEEEMIANIKETDDELAKIFGRKED